MTTAEAVNDALRRAGEDPAAPTFYQAFEALDALNEAQRLWCLLTLILEKTATVNVGGSNFHHMLSLLPDFIVPLRLRWAATGARLRPARLEDLSAENDRWPEATGDAARYSLMGCDALALSAAPASGRTLEVVYARMPATMTIASSPEVPVEHHAALVDYAVYRLRLPKEGGQESAKVLGLLDNFMSEAKACGEAVRARMVGAGYDTLPFELKEKRWTTWQSRPAQGRS